MSTVRPVPPGSGRRHRTDDAGSAVVEFALVGALLTLLFAGVLQVGVALHVRTVLVDAASEGARRAAVAGAEPQDGARRAALLVTEALSADYARDVTAQHLDGPAGPLVEVTITAPLPVAGLIGSPVTLQVSGHAVPEPQ